MTSKKQRLNTKQQMLNIHIDELSANYMIVDKLTRENSDLKKQQRQLCKTNHLIQNEIRLNTVMIKKLKNERRGLAWSIGIFRHSIENGNERK